MRSVTRCTLGQLKSESGRLLLVARMNGSVVEGGEWEGSGRGKRGREERKGERFEREGREEGRGGEMKVRGRVRREGEGEVGRGMDGKDPSKDPSKCTVHVYMPIAHHNSSS